MIIRVNRRNYTRMCNLHLKDKDLSLKAKGLMSLMLSLPENWDYSVDGLVSICKENVLCIKNTLKELKSCGYLKIVKKLPNETESGRIEYEYILYEQKQAVEKQEIEKQEVENQPIEIQAVEKQEVENQGQENTKKLITKELITDNIKENNIKEKTDNECKIVIDYLNEKASKHYKYVESNFTFIRDRLTDGYTIDELKKVIDNKCFEWSDTDMSQYLRPETLFNATKIESYLNSTFSPSSATKNGYQNLEITKYTQEEIKKMMDNLKDVKI